MELRFLTIDIYIYIYLQLYDDLLEPMDLQL